MTCIACRRRLRNPESIKAGYGPTCYERLFGKKLLKKRKGKKDGIPGQMNILDFLGN